MKISEIAAHGAKLLRVEGSVPFANRPAFGSLAFHFDEDRHLFLSVSNDDDSLLFLNSKLEGLWTTAEGVFPNFANAYGLFLTWAWEMRNHRGYFDALQMEFTDASLARSVIIQLKVAASAIEVFELSPSSRKL